ncbi:uncharacterized protein Nmag_2641 [Natrialba magadii ATCC 43099]|uniref:Uncharacterized protein n=1 Tax=Natrialba magadii (strain ATCC 43099 / DSM 3394 / CCM 3739 / CIP 104546 / IAM 13178 / JCM 8861 / NBRC 102185 / NCIMB 2190 / MS3) TaxID=547559 RepID=D3SZ08_NATMM|nr:hypothetical protein [Natrialba magadii]ADD06200.1 uncharacterized protein Nmag_2641 [Natrialba magadii ATCC 43099]ELY31087.1 hypothetical protein C500_07181 [Natrialba magadii ATCC 43099]
MTFSTSVASSIAPFDPTYGITVVASVMLVVFVVAMVFIALAPVVSGDSSETAPHGGPALETNTNEAD